MKAAAQPVRNSRSAASATQAVRAVQEALQPYTIRRDAEAANGYAMATDGGNATAKAALARPQLKAVPTAVAASVAASVAARVRGVGPALTSATQPLLPAALNPQLALPADRAPADETQWIFEIKYDGYRLLTRVDANGAVQMFNRNGADWSYKLPALRQELLRLQLPSGWYDGEVVVHHAHTGRPDFEALQACMEGGRRADVVLHLFDLPYFDGKDLREQPLHVRRAVLEKCLQKAPMSRQVGFSPALKADTGSLMASVAKLGLEGIIGKRRDSPYVSGRSQDWITLQCLGRQQVVLEKGTPSRRSTPRKAPAAPATRAASNTTAHTASMAAMPRITHAERVVDPVSGVTKGELVEYYRQVADLLLVDLQERPAAVLRAPSGLDGEKFFQKHPGLGAGPGIEALPVEGAASAYAMLQIRGVQGVLAAAQWNAVEFHTSNASRRALLLPDRMVFDLDPGEGVQWVQVQEGAALVRAFLAQLDLPSFLKTSGGKGLHVVVPLRRLHDWATVKDVSQAIVRHISTQIPQRFVARSGPHNRGAKIFIDYLRNGEGATTVSAWSARARTGMGVSVPVAWDELEDLTGGDHWTVRTATERLRLGNAPWAGYAKAGHGLRFAMQKLGYKPAGQSGAAVERIA